MPRHYYDRTILENIVCSKDVLIHDHEQQITIEKRDYLDLYFKNGGIRKLAVIMMNPSIADNVYSDGTVNSIVYWFKTGSSSVNNDLEDISKVKLISILNLFPIYSPVSPNLQQSIDHIIDYYGSYELIDKVIDSNNITLNQNIIEADYIILGWGNCPSNFYHSTYYQQINSVLGQIRNNKKEKVYIFHVRNNRAKARGVNSENILTDYKNPVHPSNGKIIGLVRVDIDSLLRILPR